MVCGAAVTPLLQQLTLSVTAQSDAVRDGVARAVVPAATAVVGLCSINALLEALLAHADRCRGVQRARTAYTYLPVSQESSAAEGGRGGGSLGGGGGGAKASRPWCGASQDGRGGRGGRRGVCGARVRGRSASFGLAEEYMVGPTCATYVAVGRAVGSRGLPLHKHH
jgi:hypothetical protein